MRRPDRITFLSVGLAVTATAAIAILPAAAGDLDIVLTEYDAAGPPSASL